MSGQQDLGLSADVAEDLTWADVVTDGDARAAASIPDCLTLASLRAASGSGEGRVAGHALVVRSEVATDRTGHPYVLLTLRGGGCERIEARWWRYPYPADRRPKVGQVCWFTGRPDMYGGATQLRIEQARPAPEIALKHFQRTTCRPEDELRAELEQRISKLDAQMAALVRTVLRDEVEMRFCTWPAAHSLHGAVRHGLLAHSLRVAALARAIAETYGVASLPYDQDMVTAACLLHDVGKVWTLPELAGAAVPDEAAYLDHVTRSVLMVRTAATQLDPPLDPTRLERLTHALLAHHGRKEWGAPVEPATVEARLVHLADLAEAQLWAWAHEECE